MKMGDKKLNSKIERKEPIEMAAERFAEILIMQIELKKKKKTKTKNDF